MPHYEEVKDVSRLGNIMKKSRMSVAGGCHIMKNLRMSVGWWLPHYEEVKDVSRLVDATL